MARTKFEHLKKYRDVYNKCVSDEKRMKSAAEKRKTDKDEVISIMADMRGTLEIIVEYMIREVGITEAGILNIMRKKNISNGGRVSLYGKILALEHYGAFTKNMADMVHSNIRKTGNNAVHYYERSPENKLVNASSKETLEYAEKMYDSLYKLSYYFTTDFADKVKKGYFNGRKRKKVKKRIPWFKIILGTVIAGVLIAVAINCLLL